MDGDDVIEHPAKLTDIVMLANFISCLLFKTMCLTILRIVSAILQAGDGADIIEHPAILTDSHTC